MILIALGANLPSTVGPPVETLRCALTRLSQRDITIESQSGFYASPAWPNPADPPFVNAVARVKTALSPEALLAVLHETEAEFGRERGQANAPRTLDLDLLDYDGRVQVGPPELPHPRMADRLFVLVPLRDIAPDWRHPVTGKAVSGLIAAAPKAEITRIQG